MSPTYLPVERACAMYLRVCVLLLLLLLLLLLCHVCMCRGDKCVKRGGGGGGGGASCVMCAVTNVSNAHADWVLWRWLLEPMQWTLRRAPCCSVACTPSCGGMRERERESRLVQCAECSGRVPRRRAWRPLYATLEMESNVTMCRAEHFPIVYIYQVARVR